MELMKLMELQSIFFLQLRNNAINYSLYIKFTLNNH